MKLEESTQFELVAVDQVMLEKTEPSGTLDINSRTVEQMAERIKSVDDDFVTGYLNDGKFQIHFTPSNYNLVKAFKKLKMPKIKVRVYKPIPY